MARSPVTRTPVPDPARDIVIGVDGGLANVGIAVVSGIARGTREQVLASARLEHLCHVKTEKLEKKMRTKIRVSTDDRTRIEKLAAVLAATAQTWPPQAIAVEWYVPNPRQMGFASGGWKTAIFVGAALGVARGLGVACLDQLPADVKALVGDRSASKEDVEAWLCEHLPGFAEMISEIARTNREHPSDGAAHGMIGLVELAERRRAAGL